jgi:hypothetical protein
MARAGRAMAMVTKRAMASNNDDDGHNNDSNRDKTYNQDNSGYKDEDANDDDNNKDNGKDDEDNDSMVAAAGGFVGSGSISGGNCGGIGGSGFGRLWVVAVVGVVIRPTTTAMHSIHNNQLKEGHAAKMPVTEAKQQATIGRSNERMRGRHNTNASAMAARWWLRQW